MARVGTPGMRTSEFLLVLAVLVCATVLAFAGHLSDAAWVQTAAVVTGLYAVGRGLAKRGSGV